MIVKQGITQTDASYKTQKGSAGVLVILGGMVVGGVIVAVFMPVGIVGSAIPAGTIFVGAIIGGVFTSSCFNPVYSSEFNNAGPKSPYPTDPIIFDLNNDGKLETTSVNNGVYFDHENDGFAEASAWVGDNDGILVVDSNNNGKIDNGTEVLLHSTLAAFDTNNDGIIDVNDADFNNLKILKGDGTLMSLAEAGIISINLNTTATNITDENGNNQFASGTFTKSDGSTGTFGEFLVSTDTTNSMATDWLDETAA